MDPLSLLWLFFILASLQPAAQRYVLEARRRANLEALAKKRGSTTITLIHRQESMSLFGPHSSGTWTSTTPKASSGLFTRHHGASRSS